MLTRVSVKRALTSMFPASACCLAQANKRETACVKRALSPCTHTCAEESSCIWTGNRPVNVSCVTASAAHCRASGKKKDDKENAWRRISRLARSRTSLTDCNKVLVSALSCSATSLCPGMFASSAARIGLSRSCISTGVRIWWVMQSVNAPISVLAFCKSASIRFNSWLSLVSLCIFLR